MCNSFSVQLSDYVLRRIMYINGKVHLHPMEEAEYHWQCLYSHRLFVSYFYACHNGMYKLNNKNYKLLYFLAVHVGTIRVNNQLDALFNVFMSHRYMFRATQCSSSGE
jgi:hypothetical protein